MKSQLLTTRGAGAEDLVLAGKGGEGIHGKPGSQAELTFAGKGADDPIADEAGEESETEKTNSRVNVLHITIAVVLVGSFSAVCGRQHVRALGMCAVPSMAWKSFVGIGIVGAFLAHQIVGMSVESEGRWELAAEWSRRLSIVPFIVFLCMSPLPFLTLAGHFLFLLVKFVAVLFGVCMKESLAVID